MKKAPILGNESARLQTLLDYHILDTLPEDDFDNIAEMAAKVLNVPLALISLVDSDRQWFKSHVGLDASETSRDISFCGHAIHEKDIMVVPDASRDERFKDNPLARDANIVFYAGAQLLAPNGEAIGTLCVIDHKPREISENERVFLKTLSKQVITQLELRKSLRSTQDAYLELRNLVKVLTKNQEKVKIEEKLDTVGGLAMGVAHEINNPLAIIAACSRAATKMIKANNTTEALECLGEINETVDRMAIVIRELMNISAQPVESFQDAKAIEKAFSESILKIRKKSDGKS